MNTQGVLKKNLNAKTQRHKEKIIERPGALCLCVFAFKLVYSTFRTPLS